MSTATAGRVTTRSMLNKVPEVTLYFWVIKILCTTVGETASDYLQSHIGLGLMKTAWITGGVLVVVLAFQFRLRRYVPGVYWLAVVLISVFGTQITDYLHDERGVSLVTTTVLFSAALAATFAIWFAFERTLSIHTIVTTRREAFYWLTVLVTFALGTAAGDLFGEKLNLGYLTSLLIFAGLIAAVFVAHRVFRLNAILAFWLAYILTRPLGASTGDYLSQPDLGGLGLGTTVTSFIFLAAILATVIFLTITKVDRIESAPPPLTAGRSAAARALLVVDHVVVTSALVDVVRERAAAGATGFALLVPNPKQLPFDRISHDIADGEAVLAQARPLLEEAAGGPIEGRVAESPNAYDDIVAELATGSYDEIILETPSSQVSHWLHVDLAHRVSHLGCKLTTVTAADGDARAGSRRAGHDSHGMAGTAET
jgi:uncharacterized membrane-anchored protein